MTRKLEKKKEKKASLVHKANLVADKLERARIAAEQKTKLLQVIPMPHDTVQGPHQRKRDSPPLRPAGDDRVHL